MTRTQQRRFLLAAQTLGVKVLTSKTQRMPAEHWKLGPQGQPRRAYSKEEGIWLRGAPGWSLCPFDRDAAIHYRGRKVWFRSLADISIDTATHELGHVVMSKDDPDASDEIRFMWWEMALARWLGGTPGIEAWRLKNNTSFRNDGYEVREVPLDVVDRWSRKAQAHGKACGLFDSMGAPVKGIR